MAQPGDDQEQSNDAEASNAPLPAVAAIEIGSSALRMTVAQPRPNDRPQILEALQQPVSLGEDTFTKGQLSSNTIEECVRTLKKFKKVLDQYQISGPEQIRAVATTAVREASNREIFLDRVYIATGLRVHPLEQAEVTRLTYLATRHLFTKQSGIKLPEALLIEIGGGSTELVQLTKQRVVQSRSCQLGSLRLQKNLEGLQTTSVKFRGVMQNHIERSLEQFLQGIELSEKGRIVALGGDMRFVASKLDSDWDTSIAVSLKVKALERFANEILDQTVEELVARFHITFPEAESLGPTLLIHLTIARLLNQKELLVSRATMRDGLLQEATSEEAWSTQVQQQIIQSAMDLGHKFRFDERHGSHVADLCRQLFHELQSEHQLHPRCELLLYIGALLHEVGLFIGVPSHHKHSMYLIRNSELFGLGERDILQVALIARYHRRASPKPVHDGYALLDREERVAVAKMAALLRLADSLDRSHQQHIHDLHCEILEDRIILHIHHVAELTIENLALQEKGNLFKQIYGKTVVLRKSDK